MARSGISKHLHLLQESGKIKHIGPNKGGHWEVVEKQGIINFMFRQEGDIKRYINGQPDKEKAAGTVYNASLPFLKVDECERVKGQLADIAQDMKEGLRQNQRRRFYM